MNNLVKKFCTPSFIEITNFDLKSIASANQTNMDFEGMQVPIYSWGQGEKVLLVHGWGSRASHMSLMARTIAEAGFNVFTFDVPAHSSVNIPPQKTSNMFEFGRTISAAVRYLKNIHTVVGHSLGAITILFTLSGFMKFKVLEFSSKKVVLISSPSSLDSIISSFSRTNNLTETEEETLRAGLEDEFNFKISDYSLESALKNIPSKLLVIHDKNDEEIPFSDAYDLEKIFPGTTLHFTAGLGHKKILFNREAIQIVSNFISGKS
jgi:pimeloyl-ACP methyl ester carboxylesterase